MINEVEPLEPKFLYVAVLSTPVLAHGKRGLVSTIN